MDPEYSNDPDYKLGYDDAMDDNGCGNLWLIGDARWDTYELGYADAIADMND